MWPTVTYNSFSNFSIFKYNDNNNQNRVRDRRYTILHSARRISYGYKNSDEEERHDVATDIHSRK